MFSLNSESKMLELWVLFSTFLKMLETLNQDKHQWMKFLFCYENSQILK